MSIEQDRELLSRFWVDPELYGTESEWGVSMLTNNTSVAFANEVLSSESAAVLKEVERVLSFQTPISYAGQCAQRALASTDKTERRSLRKQLKLLRRELLEESLLSTQCIALRARGLDALAHDLANPRYPIRQGTPKRMRLG